MPYIGNTAANRFVASKSASVFSGDGSNTGFTLDHSVGSDEDILVSVDGVIQEPSVAYSVSGTTLTFTSAPSSNSGNNIFVYYLFRTVGTVSHPSSNALEATSGTFSTTLGVTGATTLTGGLTVGDGHTIADDTNDNLEIKSSSGENIVYDSANGGHIFKKNGTEQFRIDDNNRVGIGTSGPAGLLDIQTSSESHALKVTHSENADKNLITLQHTYAQSSQTATMIQFKDSGGSERGSIKTSGSATAFNTSSDYRLKENVTYDFDATTRLKQLKPCRFNFIVDADNTVDGFLAHEVSSIVPEAITGEKDATETYTDDDGNEQTRIKPQGIDQSKIVPLLVKTIQELEARITALESK